MPYGSSGSCRDDERVTRVLIVPGAAVRSYVRPAADALRDRGVEVHLLAHLVNPMPRLACGNHGQQLAH